MYLVHKYVKSIFCVATVTQLHPKLKQQVLLLLSLFPTVSGVYAYMCCFYHSGQPGCSSCSLCLQVNVVMFSGARGNVVD
jgi:hypothetical protein